MTPSQRDAVIVAAVRTPIGKRGKMLSQTRPDELVAQVLQEVVCRAGIDPKDVEDVIMGCCTQVDEQGVNVGRLASLVAGFPVVIWP